jgi:hypothetical protein
LSKTFIEFKTENTIMVTAVLEFDTADIIDVEQARKKRIAFRGAVTKANNRLKTVKKQLEEELAKDEAEQDFSYIDALYKQESEAEDTFTDAEAGLQAIELLILKLLRASKSVSGADRRQDEYAPPPRSLHQALTQKDDDDDKDVGLPSENQDAKKLKALRAAVSSLDVPQLTESFGLENHLKMLELMLVEAGAGKNIGNRFVPQSGLRVTIAAKLLQTVKPVADVYNTAKEEAVHADYEWHRIRETLTDEYCRREVLLSQYEKRANKLRLTNSEDVDDFLRSCRSVHHLCRQLYKDRDTSHRIAVVRRIVQAIKIKDLAKMVVRELRSRREDPQQDWELAVPVESVMNIIQDLCRGEETIRFLHNADDKPANNRQPERLAAVTDSVNAISDSKPKHQQQSLSDWAKSFHLVLYVSGGGVTKPEYQTAAKELEDKAEVKKIPFKNSQQRKFFYLFGCKDKGGEEAVQSKLSSLRGLTVRPFEAKN